MHTRPLIPFLLLASILTAGRADAQFAARQPQATGEDFHLELGAMFWKPSPELIIATDALRAVSIDQVDFVQEFGIEDKTFTEFRMTAKPGRKHKIRFSYVPFTYDQDAQLQRTVTFNGRTFPINVAANAQIEWKLWRLGYEWDFVSSPHGLIGLITEVKYNKVFAQLSSGSNSATEDIDAAVPTLGLIGRGYVSRNVSITAEFTGLKLPKSIRDRFKGDNDEFDVDFADFDLYGTASLSRYFGVQGGYHYVSADYVIDNDSGDLTMKGLYFGGLLRF